MANLVVATGASVTGPASATPHANRNAIVVVLNRFNATSTASVSTPATSTPTVSDG